MPKLDKIEIAKKYGLNLNDLHEKQIIHEDNPVTKKDIFENTSKKQQELMIYYHKDGLTWQDLDPRLNRFGSVRHQFLKNSGHYIGENTYVWNCWVEECNHFQTQTVVYFITFGDSKRNLSSDKIHCDDISVIGHKGTIGEHILTGHPEEGRKQLAKLGVTVK